MKGAKSMLLRIDRELMSKLDKAAAQAYRSREGFVRELLAAKLGSSSQVTCNKSSYLQRLRSSRPQK